jgi:hypothetical protein
MSGARGQATVPGAWRPAPAAGFERHSFRNFDPCPRPIPGRLQTFFGPGGIPLRRRRPESFTARRRMPARRRWATSAKSRRKKRTAVFTERRAGKDSRRLRTGCVLNNPEEFARPALPLRYLRPSPPRGGIAWMAQAAGSVGTMIHSQLHQRSPTITNLSWKSMQISSARRFPAFPAASHCTKMPSIAGFFVHLTGRRAHRRVSSWNAVKGRVASPFSSACSVTSASPRPGGANA